MSRRLTPMPEDWQPGDPLHAPDPHSRYIFNWRDDDAARLREDDCICPDRACWPTPNIGRELPDDPLAAFIQEYRIWKELNPDG